MIRKLLMCPPWKYDVAHFLQNAHMKMSREVLHHKAQKQWISLYNLLTHDLGTQVYLSPPAVGMMDMVFAANAGLVRGNKAIVSNFTAHARKGETEPYLETLENLDFECKVTENEFEGQGDALFSHNGTILWIGHGFRTNPHSHDEVANYFDLQNNVDWDDFSYSFVNNKDGEEGVNCFPMRLINPKFYHLDTCFCPLDGGNLLFYPKAFTQQGRKRIYSKFSEDKCIEVDDEDAELFACNAISIGEHVIMHQVSDKLKYDLQNYGYIVHENNMSEFLLSGGSTKCSVLHLDWV